MTVLIVLLIFAGFVILDLLVRMIGRRVEGRRIQRQRQAVLETTLQLEFDHEAKSLQRAEVPDARATVLAVDDEPVVLDSLRKILVLDGFSVDTVESGPEALSLVQRRDYDFVFTDLKMPGMDGVEVVKAVHHLRPDADIAVITGYATIDSAVETMQHGAVAYFQKPFTADELTEFAGNLLIKRQARLEAQHRPSVWVVAPEVAEVVAGRDFCVPGGAFISDGHAWARLEADGQVRIGMDDFARKALGSVTAVDLPDAGREVRRGDPLFALRRGEQIVHFAAPISGRVAAVNEPLLAEPAKVAESPYHAGWICLVEPADLPVDLASLRIGQPVIDWYGDEIDRLRQAGGPADNGAPAVSWHTFEERFLRPAEMAVTNAG